MYDMVCDVFLCHMLMCIYVVCLCVYCVFSVLHGVLLRYVCDVVCLCMMSCV